MCIVIDACCGESLSNPSLPQSQLLLEWVRNGGRVVSGGQLQKELGKTPIRPLLAQWSASGRLILISDTEVASESKKIKALALKSNDSHLLAVAKISSAKVVVTRDKPLMADLKNRSVMGESRKIYPMPDDPSPNLRINRGVLRNSGCR